MSNTAEESRLREQFWTAHIDKLEESGKSHREYCDEYGLKIHTLRYWTRILGRTKRQVRASKAESVSFMALRMTESEVSSDHLYEIVIGTRSLRIGRGFEIEEVKQLVQALEC